MSGHVRLEADLARTGAKAAVLLDASPNFVQGGPSSKAFWRLLPLAVLEGAA